MRIGVVSSPSEGAAYAASRSVVNASHARPNWTLNTWSPDLLRPHV